MALDDLTVAFSQVLPQITAIVANPTNGSVQIGGVGESNRTYEIEAATNLSSPIFWQLIASNLADSSGFFQFTDTNAVSFRTRFYRALVK